MECEEELKDLEDKKKPLLHEKDETSRQILRAEDCLKQAQTEARLILSTGCDNEIFDLQRQVIK